MKELQGDKFGFINLELRLLAEALNGIEAERIASENRLRQMTRMGPDKDGKRRGLGLPEDWPGVVALRESVAKLKEAEARVSKEVEKGFRPHPLRPWALEQKGVGDKQLARLLMAIGDPYWNHRDDRPRTVGELRAYCGYGGDEDGRPQRRVRGQKSNWSSGAKMRAFLVAEKCVMMRDVACGELQKDKPYEHVDDCKCGRYRFIYEEGRMKAEATVHKWACPPCGPKGKPAQSGSSLSPGHVDAYAKRFLAKEILKDLWIAAREVHQE